MSSKSRIQPILESADPVNPLKSQKKSVFEKSVFAIETPYYFVIFVSIVGGSTFWRFFLCLTEEFLVRVTAQQRDCLVNKGKKLTMLR